MRHDPVLIILLPLAGAFIASLIPERPRSLARLVAATAALLHAAVVLRLLLATANSQSLIYELGSWSAPLGIVLVADPLSAFFLALLAVGHLLFLFHAVSEEGEPRRSLWILTELLVAALSGILVAGDLFNLFVFLELASVSSVGLMIHKQRAEGAGAGFVYLLFTSLSGVLYLIAVVLIYRHLGVLSLEAIALEGEAIPPRSYRAAAGLLTVSLGMKFGLVPFHFWQAPAYDAAGSSVAALLSGTGMKIYLYALIRLLVQVFSAGEIASLIAPLVVTLGTVNILVGHSLALGERDLKRLLAYSSVAHVGYILIAVAALLVAPTRDAAGLAAAAALLHIAFHAVMKSALFYAGRTLIDRQGSSTIGFLRGVGRREMVGFAAFVVAALALVGIPPMNGFYSKWRVALSAYGAFGPAPVIVIALGTVISMLYYARLFHVGLREAGSSAPTGPGAPHGAARAADSFAAPTGPGASRGAAFAAPRRPGGPRPGASNRTRVLVALLALACLLLGVFGPALEALLDPAAALLAAPGDAAVSP